MEAEKIPKNEELSLTEKIDIYEEALQKGYLLDDEDLKKIPTLNREEEIEFAQKIEQGEKIYEHYLLVANLRFLGMRATKTVFAGDNFEREDVIQEGVIGLMKSIKKFEYEKGNKFLTYAEWWVKQNINRERENKADIIRIPVNLKNLVLDYKKKHEILYKELHREPTTTEIAQEMGITNKKVKRLEDLSKICVVSIDKPIKNENGELYWSDRIKNTTFGNPEEIALRNAYKQKISELIENLEEKEKEIIKSLFPLNKDNPKTLEDIGERFGLTKQRISMIKQKILEKLKISLIQQENQLIEEVLENYTDIERKVLELRFGLNNRKSKSREKTKAVTGLNENEIEKIENKCLKEIVGYYIENM